MFSKTVQITSDGTGQFSKSETSKPPTLFDISVNIKATLVSPPNLSVDATYDINAQDGSGTNPPRQIQGNSGQVVDLGMWNLSHRGNVITVSGATVPPSANTVLTFQIDASL